MFVDQNIFCAVFFWRAFCILQKNSRSLLLWKPMQSRAQPRHDLLSLEGCVLRAWPNYDRRRGIVTRKIGSGFVTMFRRYPYMWPTKLGCWSCNNVALNLESVTQFNNGILTLILLKRVPQKQPATWHWHQHPHRRPSPCSRHVNGIKVATLYTFDLSGSVDFDGKIMYYTTTCV